MGTQGEAAAEAAGLETTFMELSSLIPMAKNVSPLEEIAALMTLDITGEAGDLKRTKRKILVSLNSDTFDESADKEAILKASHGIIRKHLGFEKDDENTLANPGWQIQDDENTLALMDPPKLEESEEDDDLEENFKDVKDELLSERSRRSGALLGTGTRIERLKDFKLSGAIGNPGEKGKLTYSSLKHQVESGLKLGYPETEICNVVIRGITPGNVARVYLEGRKNLTVKKLLTTLKSYFCEKNVTTVYNQMTRAVQGTEEKDTPITFAIRMFALRDQVLELSKQPGAHKYSRKLVQAEMQKSIYAGIRDEGIRRDLKETLTRTPNVDDDDLLEEISQAMSSLEEHELRIHEAGVRRKTGGGKAQVSVVGVDQESTDDERSKSNNHNKGNKNQKKDGAKSGNKEGQGNTSTSMDGTSQGMPNMEPFLAQMSVLLGVQLQSAMEPLKSQVNELMGFKREYEKATNSGPSARGKTNPPVDNPNKSLDPKANVFSAKTANPANVAAPSPACGLGWGADGFASKTPAFQGVDNLRYGATARTGPHPLMGNLRFEEFMRQAMDQNTKKPPKKCKKCMKYGTQYCNHCYICFTTEHRFFECPHRGDPTFVPPLV